MGLTSAIGTSGWAYSHWKGPFYPADLPAAEFLDFYPSQFDTVEINSSFYYSRAEDTVRHWPKSAPPGFIHAAKASRYLTHMKKLKDPKAPLGIYLERIALPGDRLGPILFQLPPRRTFNPDRLDAFLHILPEGFRYAFDFRDES